MPYIKEFSQSNLKTDLPQLKSGQMVRVRTTIEANGIPELHIARRSRSPVAGKVP